MSEQNPKIEAAEQQVAAVQTRNLNSQIWWFQCIGIFCRWNTEPQSRA